MSNWREQYDRVGRWYKRFAFIIAMPGEDQDTHLTLDDVHAFFQNCWHLKDWVKNDPALLPQVKEDILDLAHKSPPLLMCREICNSVKHLNLGSLNHPDMKKENTVFQFANFAMPAVKMKCGVITSTGTRDAFDLAAECIGAWDTILSKHSLL